MSAKIILFPVGVARPSPRSDALATAGLSEGHPLLARKFADHYLPIVQASLELIEVDERDFEARCRQVLDVEGGEMIDELCGELQIVWRLMQAMFPGQKGAASSAAGPEAARLWLAN